MSIVSITTYLLCIVKVNYFCYFTDSIKGMDVFVVPIPYLTLVFEQFFSTHYTSFATALKLSGLVTTTGRINPSEEGPLCVT